MYVKLRFPKLRLLHANSTLQTRVVDLIDWRSIFVMADPCFDLLNDIKEL